MHNQNAVSHNRIIIIRLNYLSLAFRVWVRHSSISDKKGYNRKFRTNSNHPLTSHLESPLSCPRKLQSVSYRDSFFLAYQELRAKSEFVIATHHPSTWHFTGDLLSEEHLMTTTQRIIVGHLFAVRLHILFVALYPYANIVSLLLSCHVKCRHPHLQPHIIIVRASSI